MALLSKAKGTGHITETTFENRFMDVQKLVRLGAAWLNRVTQQLSRTCWIWTL